MSLISTSEYNGSRKSPRIKASAVLLRAAEMPLVPCIPPLTIELMPKAGPRSIAVEKASQSRICLLLD